MSGVDVSVVIPCFRSGPWLVELAERLDDSLDDLGGVSEVLLVHDASGAETWGIIEELARRYERFGGIDLAERVGQHRATLCGFEGTGGAIVVTMDDDLEHRPEDVPRLVDTLRSRPDVACVMAAFPEERRSALRRGASVVMDRLYHYRYGGPPGLQMTPFRAMTRALAEELVEGAGDQPFMPRLLLEATPRLMNLAVGHESSRSPSRYSTRDLLRLAWKGLGLSPSAKAPAPTGSRARVRERVGRGAPVPTDPTGAD